MICDTHLHTWRFPDHIDLDSVRRKLSPKRKDMSENDLARLFDLPIEQYLEDSKDSDVGFGILVGADAIDSLGIKTTNDYLAEVARAHPHRFAHACCVNPTAGSAAAEEVERSERDGAVAIGELTPAMTGFHFDDPQCDVVWDIASQLELPVMVHTGPSEGAMVDLRFVNTNSIDVVARKFPKLKIVICHMGAPYFDEVIYLLGKHRNVYADVSQLPTLAGIDRRVLKPGMPPAPNPYFNWVYPIASYFSQIFGRPDKLIWGTDFPAGNAKVCIDSVRNFNVFSERFGFPEVPQVHLDRILEENWKKVFSRIRVENSQATVVRPSRQTPN